MAASTLATIASFAVIAGVRVSAQANRPFTMRRGDWPSYTGDRRGARYSPLDQVNALASARLGAAPVVAFRGIVSQ